MSIKPLPEDVVSQIRSSVAITTLNEVVCGLLKNSLDAGSTRITVSIDYGRGNCSVEDNGLGIPPAEFAPDGGLCKLQHTSKYPPRRDLYGRHGVFLASLASLSLLSVASRHHQHSSHNSLSVHNSATIVRQVPAPVEQHIISVPHGTRVTVRDLFGSMPVRVKQRALEADRSGAAKELDQLVLHLVALLLAWPTAVSVSVRDASSRRAFNMRLGDSTENSRLPETKRFPRLLSQSSLYDGANLGDWVSVGVSAPGFTISGCVSLAPFATKRLQFISLGVEPILSSALFDDINKIFANSSFGIMEDDTDEDDSLASPAADFTKRELRARKGIDRWPVFSIRIELLAAAAQEWQLRRTNLDQNQQSLAAITRMLRVMFCQFLKKHNFRPTRMYSGLEELDVVLPGHSNGNKEGSIQEPRSTILEQASERREKSRTPNKRAPSRSSNSQVQASRTSLGRANSPFASWSRVKVGEPATDLSARQGCITSGKQASAQETAGSTTRADVPEMLGRSPLFDSSGRLLRKPLDEVTIPHPSRVQETGQVAATESCSPAPHPHQDESDGTFEWIDPTTKVKCVINSRTGWVVSRANDRETRLVTRQSRPSSAQHPRADDEEEAESGRDSSLAKSVLMKWKNPVFELTEAPIPRLLDTLEKSSGVLDGSVQPNRTHSVTFADRYETSSVGLQAKVSKAALEHAEVITQVDRKFILAKVHVGVGNGGSPTEELSGNTLLLLIDQHAADERCRLEDLMRCYFESSPKDQTTTAKANTEGLDRPLRLDLSEREAQLLDRFRTHFAYWGIIYEVFEHHRDPLARGRKGTNAVRTEVSRLPPSILERCRQEPRLLVDLLRKEIWRLQDEPGSAVMLRSLGDNEQDEHSEEERWFSRFHGCPQGILDLLHSRSCRSAIMFNDELSLGQCRDLVRKLARCTFPFQCAHGRPSLVPLVDLGTSRSLIGPELSKKDDGFAQAFRQWKAQKEKESHSG